MNFMYLDITFLVLFVVLTAIFLVRNRKKIKKEGLLWLYHTSWGLKLIHNTGQKYKKTLKFLSWVSVSLGYALMVGIVWLFGRMVWIYAFHGDLVRAIKMPPIMPLIPYLPQIFKLDFLPPFYFSYWIIILAIIAVSHEFFHGIFASISGIKTKTTGFGFFPFFLPIFLAAFVNLDEKAMEKKSNFQQRAVLSAGTFANILTAILGVILMWGFFSLTFSPAGVMYDDYAYSVVNITDITEINGIPINLINMQSPDMSKNISKFSDIRVGNQSFLAIKIIDPTTNLAALYFDAPAIRINLSGVISEINNKKIKSLDDLSFELDKYSPGEKISLLTYDGKNYKNQDIVLGENPTEKNKSWLGVSFANKKKTGIIGKISSIATLEKKPNVFYLPKFEFAKFIYDLLWWLVLISFSVALMNMLPMGIFDGGRFFYLTILAITKSKKVAEKSFKYITRLFLLALLVIMIFWAKNLF